MNGNILELGVLSVSTLLDNHLRQCPSGPPGPGVRCSQAAIRVYTQGAIPGFVNLTDNTYGVPLLAEGNEVGLGVLNSVDLTTFNIPNNMNVLRLTNLSKTDFEIQSDFTNAGMGNYEVTLVVEYILRP